MEPLPAGGKVLRYFNPKKGGTTQRSGRTWSRRDPTPGWCACGRGGRCGRRPSFGTMPLLWVSRRASTPRMLRRGPVTQSPVKVTLPGPYMLNRSTWVKGLSEAAYPTRESLADEVIAILRSGLCALAEAGADIVQFGEAVDLINRVVGGVQGPLLAVHVCRGNWSRKEDILLQGPYDPLIPCFSRMQVHQLVLEYATPRAGSPEPLRQLPANIQITPLAASPRLRGGGGRGPGPSTGRVSAGWPRRGGRPPGCAPRPRRYCSGRGTDAPSRGWR